MRSRLLASGARVLSACFSPVPRRLHVAPRGRDPFHPAHLASSCARVAAPRSGLAWKHFIDTGAGVIDADYRGNVGVILFNHADKDFEVSRGDRVAQLVLERIATPEVVQVEDLDD